MIGSVWHLNEHVVAAFADGALPAASHARAQQHVTACLECAEAVRAQQEASHTLRQATPLAAGPSSELMQRLLHLPVTAELADSAASAFTLPSFGDVFAADGLPPAPVPARRVPRPGRTDRA